MLLEEAQLTHRDQGLRYVDWVEGRHANDKRFFLFSDQFLIWEVHPVSTKFLGSGLRY